jgi:hypothetical protein
MDRRTGLLVNNVTGNLYTESNEPVTVEQSSSGELTFSDLIPGGYKVVVSGLGYGVVNVAATVVVNSTVTVNVLLTAVVEFRGQVRDSASSIGIVGVECKLLQYGIETATASTDTEGKYVFSEVPAGETYTFSVSKSGYEPYSEEFSVVVGQNVTKDVALRPVPTLSMFSSNRTIFTPSADSSEYRTLSLRFNLAPGVTVVDSGGVVKIYNLRGRLVRTLSLADMQVTKVTGANIETMWDGTDDRQQLVPTGIYFYRLEVDGQVRTGKVILAR